MLSRHADQQPARPFAAHEQSRPESPSSTTKVSYFALSPPAASPKSPYSHLSSPLNSLPVFTWPFFFHLTFSVKTKSSFDGSRCSPGSSERPPDLRQVLSVPIPPIVSLSRFALVLTTPGRVCARGLPAGHAACAPVGRESRHVRPRPTKHVARGCHAGQRHLLYF
jgi:hypothetical protein